MSSSLVNLESISPTRNKNPLVKTEETVDWQFPSGAICAAAMWKCCIARHFYPSYPSEKKFIREFSEFQVEDSQTEYGQTIAGFLNPARTGSYRFAIASDDSSELWLSPSESPEEKQLIASVFVEGATGWTTKNEINKYPNQISRDIKLRDGGRYYIEVIHKQGEGDGFVQVFWSNPGVTDFKLISSEYLSSCSDPSKQDAMNQLLAKRLAISQTAWKKTLQLFHSTFDKRRKLSSAMHLQV